jgi:hypothetical protein
MRLTVSGVGGGVRIQPTTSLVKRKVGNNRSRIGNAKRIDFVGRRVEAKSSDVEARMTIISQTLCWSWTVPLQYARFREPLSASHVAWGYHSQANDVSLSAVMIKCHGGNIAHLDDCLQDGQILPLESCSIDTIQTLRLEVNHGNGLASLLLSSLYVTEAMR